MRAWLGAAAVTVAVGLSGCGSSGTTSSASAPGTGPASGTSTGAPATTTVTETSTPAVSGGIPRCRAAGLAVSFLGQQGATGHGELGFAVKNTTGASCHTYGFPGVLFLGKSGQPLPTHSTWTTHDFFGVAPKVAITVAPGATASFRLGVTHGLTSPVGCTTAYALQVIPPDDTATLRVSIPQGGAFECQTVTVSPLRPGTTAYP